MDLRARYRKHGAVGFLRWFLIKRVGRGILVATDRFFARQSLVGDPPVIDGSAIPWVAALEADWKSVRRELDGLLEQRELLPAIHEIQPDQYNLSKGDLWKTCFLFGYGARSERNCARCPETVRLLDAIPGVTLAWFSILAPGIHIPRHAGITKGVIRCHLGLIVPRGPGRCEIEVDGTFNRWEEGRLLLFDDSRRHEVWNDTAEERVALLFDVVRPMRGPGRVLMSAVVQILRWSPFVRTARRNQLAWEQKMDMAEAARGARPPAPPPTG
jgi:aspartyl/asparaginyl beta-hydroxylase (cupin superfamily)